MSELQTTATETVDEIQALAALTRKAEGELAAANDATSNLYQRAEDASKEVEAARRDMEELAGQLTDGDTKVAKKYADACALVTQQQGIADVLRKRYKASREQIARAEQKLADAKSRELNARIAKQARRTFAAGTELDNLIGALPEKIDRLKDELKHLEEVRSSRGDRLGDLLRAKEIAHIAAYRAIHHHVREFLRMRVPEIIGQGDYSLMAKNLPFISGKNALGVARYSHDEIEGFVNEFFPPKSPSEPENQLPRPDSENEAEVTSEDDGKPIAAADSSSPEVLTLTIEETPTSEEPSKKKRSQASTS